MPHTLACDVQHDAFCDTEPRTLGITEQPEHGGVCGRLVFRARCLISKETNES